MRVLVTGSQGFIGAEQVRVLIGAGHEIRTFDRAAAKNGGEWEHQPGDLRDLMAVRRAVQGMDAVVHLGAISHDQRGNDDGVLTVNVQGTWNVLIASVEAGIGRVVYYSSVNSLGNFGGHRPSAYLPIDDSYPRHPMSPYQLSKHLGEETCRSYSNKHGIVTVCLRPMFVASPEHYTRWKEQDSERRAQWSRSDYWAYVDLRDVCDAGLRGLTVEGVSHDAFLLAAEDTVLDVPTAELVNQFYPDTPWPRIDRETYLAGRPYRSLIDCSHAAEKLEWKARHSWRGDG